MKFRCPYCKEAFPLDPAAICPNCKKAIKVPQDLEKSIARMKEAQANEGVPRRIVIRPFSLTSPAIPVMIAIMAIISVTLYSQWKKSPYRYSTVEFHDPKTLIAKAARASFELAERELRVLRLAFEIFRKDCGRYPTTEEGLMALLNDPGVPGWKGPYVLFTRPDPWRTRYQYSFTNNMMMLFSCGPDQQPDTADDLRPAEPSDKDRNDYGLTNMTGSTLQPSSPPGNAGTTNEIQIKPSE